MSRCIRTASAVALIALVAGCANISGEEYVVLDLAPLSSEPGYTGKYK